VKNAHEFDGLYDDLFDFTKAGYVMIDVENPLGNNLADKYKDWQYVSPNPDLYWMNGLMSKWHVTARGPLDPRVRQKHCKQVLEAVELPDAFITGDIEIFPSPYPETPYDCAVLLIEDDSLFEINQQLAVLPGVQTYIPYKPHLTIGYFEAGHREELENLYPYTKCEVKVLGWDFGRMEP
jgi:hypothetical protein